MSKKHKPTTPGRRSLVLSSTAELSLKKNAPLKALVTPKKRISCRNNKGHITVRARGGGHKRKYRLIDFKRTKDHIPAKVATIEYDPNRSAFIALLHYQDGEKRYIIAPKGIQVGDMVQSGVKAPLRVGNALPLENMPEGSVIHNIELYPGRGGQLVRGAGLSAQLVGRSGEYAVVKLPSNETRMVPIACRATLGAVSNAENSLRSLGKAGRMRWLGRRPLSRGTVTNPVDGPMGGGEGKQKGKHPRSPWGVFSKGFKTRSRKKDKRLIIKDRRKK